ncbi:hypothetical protein CMUS01_13784, partial [Colletotrichum musicola]
IEPSNHPSLSLLILQVFASLYDETYLSSATRVNSTPNMRASTIFTAAASLFLGAEANPMRRNDPHSLNFRIWSERGCGADGLNSGNLGVWTITQSTSNQCQPTFNSDEVKGIFLNAVEDRCEMFAYTGANCEGTGHPVSLKECVEPPAPAATWTSFYVKCAEV